jgi:hypothetical protein
MGFPHFGLNDVENYGSTIFNRKNKILAADLPYGHDVADFRDYQKNRVNSRNPRQMLL